MALNYQTPSMTYGYLVISKLVNPYMFAMSKG